MVSAVRCDFLSFCIFDMLNTILKDSLRILQKLWFPFILYLWYVEHNHTWLGKALGSVVISFHFVSLICWAQFRPYVKWHSCSCDFLSFCIFDMLNTIPVVVAMAYYRLWFPFILYLWYVEHNKLTTKLNY